MIHRSLMRRVLAVVPLAALPAFIAAQAPAARAMALPRDSSLQALVDARVAAGANPAVAALRITPAGVEIAFAGDPKSPDGRPLGPRTLFEIGSITKVVTGTLFADAIRRGEVTEEERLVQVFPGLPLPAGGDSITLLDLATHHSGLESMPSRYVPPDSTEPYASFDSVALVASWAATPLRFAPGKRFEYSNIGAAMLGQAIVTRARVRDYETLVRTRFARPLGLRDFGYRLSPEQRRRLATGHNRLGVPVKHLRLTYLAPAGAIVSSLADMRRLAEACLGQGQAEVVAAVTEAQRPRRRASATQRVGLHWISQPRPDSSAIRWHNGATLGFTAYLGCNRTTGRAAVVLTNSEVDADDLGRHLVDPWLPLRPMRPPALTSVGAVDTVAMDGLVGRYELSPTFVITVLRAGTRLVAQATGQGPLRLVEESADRWAVADVEARLEFERDATGRVAAVVLVQNGLRQRAVRVP